VDPDIVVDNLPHETLNGRDAQLEAALEFLEEKIREEPVEVPDVPSHPRLVFSSGYPAFLPVIPVANL